MKGKRNITYCVNEYDAKICGLSLKENSSMLVCKNHAKQIRRVRKPLTNGDVVVLQTEKRTSKSEKYTENQRMKFSVAAALGVPISLVGEIYSIFSANDNLETLQKGPSKNTTALGLIELYECFLNQSAFIMS